MRHWYCPCGRLLATFPCGWERQMLEDDPVHCPFCGHIVRPVAESQEVRTNA